MSTSEVVKMEVRRALKPSDGGWDYAIIGFVQGQKCCVAEVFEVLGHGIRTNAQQRAELFARAPDLLAENERLRSALERLVRESADYMELVPISASIAKQQTPLAIAVEFARDALARRNAE